MTIHKLSAGSGYAYLTRQVAVLDSTEKGATSLADYYSAKGESPGRWVGSGLAGIDGLAIRDLVSAEQMKHLFGTGSHPLTGDALGAAYRTYNNADVDDFNAAVARRVRNEGGARGSYDTHARARTDVARERFIAAHEREPKDARELSDALAGYAKPRQSAVAGFDLTFSPVKSVSALWAVAPPHVAQAIEAAHDAAVRDALSLIERQALFTREGRNGVRQVETRGMIATAFTHRDSRAGDPDLHTHVAVANKVQTRSGKWLSIYGKVLFEHTVAASEAYNTALELRLAEALGVEFVERPAGARDKRPVREIAGVPALLCERWSQRRKAITTRQRELAREFTQAHGRPPTPVEAVALAQQANLETRDAKHEPRAEAAQRAGWRAEAVEVLGSQVAVRAMVGAVVHRSRSVAPPVSSAWVETAAERVVAEVASRRATWQVWHLRAEAQRQVRGVAVPADRVGEVVEWILDDAITRLSVNLTPDLDPVPEPVGLRRSDGTSVYRHTGRDHFSSRRVLEAEQRIVALAGRRDALAWSPDDVELAVLAAAVKGIQLNQGQEALVHAMATSGARVQLALAPAGSGKTTAMRVLAEVWREGGCRTLGLAPSAAAAAALAEATGMPCETLAKLTHDLRHNPTSSLVSSIGPGTLLVIDEAGMADTLTLAAVVEHAVARGASVRLIGDDRQLAAIGAGGVLRDIGSTHGACRLDDLVRFADPSEGEASLALREGDRAALGFYLDHDRVHVGDVASCLDEVYAAWSAGRATGRDCLMLAPTRDLVRELNLRAQASRALSGASNGLADGCQAHRGDVVISRRNDRRLGVSGTDWVKNGDRWIVAGVRADGGLDVQHATSRLHAALPAAYVSAHVDLGYAATVHTAQGITTDVVHGLVTGTEDRQMLYTMLTRGRVENHAHLVLDPGETHAVPSSVADRMLTATEMLEGVLSRDGAAASATSVQARAASPAALLHDAAARYADAVALATAQVRAEPIEDGPLPWLAGIPDEVAEHPGWGPYLAARSRRVVSLAAEVAAVPTLPEWMSRFDGDVVTPELRRELAVWRAATGLAADERTIAGPVPNDDREASYHRRLTHRIDARYGDAINIWAERIVKYVGTRDDQTLELAKHLDQLARRGVDAERILGRAVARRPLPVDHATAALASRVRSLSAAPRRTAPPPDFSSHPYGRRSGPGLGL